MFYPEYLLAKLYNESDQKQKAIDTATKILNKEIKIKTTAIKEGVCAGASQCFAQNNMRNAAPFPLQKDYR